MLHTHTYIYRDNMYQFISFGSSFDASFKHANGNNKTFVNQQAKLVPKFISVGDWTILLFINYPWSYLPVFLVINCMNRDWYPSLKHNFYCLKELTILPVYSQYLLLYITIAYFMNKGYISFCYKISYRLKQVYLLI